MKDKPLSLKRKRERLQSAEAQSVIEATTAGADEEPQVEESAAEAEDETAATSPDASEDAEKENSKETTADVENKEDLVEESLDEDAAEEKEDAEAEDESEEEDQGPKMGRPRLEEPKIKKTLHIEVKSQAILNRLVTRLFDVRGKKPKEGELVDQALELLAAEEGIKVETPVSE